MSQKLHLIYIPGLGDLEQNITFKYQRWAVGTWPRWGVEAELFQMNWADNRSWQSKFDQLLERIDELVSQKKSVGLVGASAGASAVINAYAARKAEIVGVVCIAGKINRPSAVGGSYRRNNPSFITSVQDCQTALASLDTADRKRILSRYGIADETVYKPDSRIPGAYNRLVPMVGHVPVIATQLLFGAPGFIRFIKRRDR